MELSLIYHPPEDLSSCCSLFDSAQNSCFILTRISINFISHYANAKDEQKIPPNCSNMNAEFHSGFKVSLLKNTVVVEVDRLECSYVFLTEKWLEDYYKHK